LDLLCHFGITGFGGGFRKGFELVDLGAHKVNGVEFTWLGGRVRNTAYGRFLTIFDHGRRRNNN